MRRELSNASTTSIYDHLGQCAAFRAFEGATLRLYRDVVCLSDQMRISAAGPARDWSDVGRGWRED